MNKFYTLFAALLIATPLFAQNVLLYEDFEAEFLDHILYQLPGGNDQTWINADLDGMPDASAAGNRPGEWFLSFGFADVDSLNVVMASNSWTNESTLAVANYLILPPIQLDAADGMLYWKNAPYQTPRFVDGLQVLVSTTGNYPEDFTDTLMLYAEYLSGEALPDDSTYANYTFSEGYVFGLNGDWVEFHNDSARFRGVLRPDSASLAAYAGQTVYIAFCHGTTDDNLQSVDEIKVTGTGKNLPVNNVSAELGKLETYPNPAADGFRITYDLPRTGAVRLNVYDATGRLVKGIVSGTQLHGHYYFDVDTRDWANGQYSVSLDAPHGNSNVKVTVQK
ncbi:MAG TPA: choice-of-anchor J domain-containing protein [Chitinophagales bacterium]|nr:choice-of-anchor J domain-containing protein [Chitinophagales bacterium]